MSARPGSLSLEPAIDSARLSLRALREDDAELYCELLCEPRTMRYIGAPWSRARAARSFRVALDLACAARPGALFRVLVEKATQHAIGLGTLQHVEWERRRAEIGMMLQPGACRRGFAREATVALTAAAFATLPLDELHAKFAVNHHAAQRVLLEAGYAAAAPSADPAMRVVCAYRATWVSRAATLTD